MKLYNTLTRTLEEFVPLDPTGSRVGLYVCGPTVYDAPHIGHARSAYIFDVLRRHLKHRGYDVAFVRNVTDVDDKIIARAKELGETPEALATRELARYHETMDRLGIGRPDVEPKATEHVVPDMTDFIAKLSIRGAAYEAKGDVYFAVRKCPGYGKLSNRALDELQAGARVEPDEHKQDPLDFALWKSAKPGEPSWNSPWGAGRPGWHIECSAMSTKYLGDAFDIHGGGVDLVFPHHENEVAQARAAGKPFAKCWVHNGLLTVKGEKMSKSLGNYVTVEQALGVCENVRGAGGAGQGNPRGSADILKVFFLGANYRSPIDWTPENLKAAAKRYRNYVHALHTAGMVGRNSQAKIAALADVRSAFVEAMDDDMNTPRALAVLDQLASSIMQKCTELEMFGAGQESSTTVSGYLRSAYHTLRELGAHLGLFQDVLPIRLPEEVRNLIKSREEARKGKDFQTADRLRLEIERCGFTVEDTPSGPKVLEKF